MKLYFNPAVGRISPPPPTWENSWRHPCLRLKLGLKQQLANNKIRFLLFLLVRFSFCQFARTASSIRNLVPLVNIRKIVFRLLRVFFVCILKFKLSFIPNSSRDYGIPSIFLAQFHGEERIDIKYLLLIKSLVIKILRVISNF